MAINFNSSANWNDEYKEEEKGFICYHKGDGPNQFDVADFNLLNLF